MLLHTLLCLCVPLSSLLHPLLSSLRGSSDVDCVCVDVCVSLSMEVCPLCSSILSSRQCVWRVGGCVAPSCLGWMLFHRRLSERGRDEKAQTNRKKDG